MVEETQVSGISLIFEKSNEIKNFEKKSLGNKVTSFIIPTLE